MASRFVEQPALAAYCASANAPARSSALRLMLGHCDAPPPAMARARTLAAGLAGEPPGRVHAGGPLADAALHRALASALPAVLQPSLRPAFEWYGCRGAHFHTDAHYGDVLFGAWCLAGPARTVVFARGGVRAPAALGDFVVFDPFEPHAVLDSPHERYAAEHYAGAAASVFLGFELTLTAATMQAFGIAAMAAPARGMRELSSRIAVNAETGELG